MLAKTATSTMAESSAIAWTKSTFNPWIGCTKVGPGCDHCYAEALDKRHRWKGTTHWGAGVERMRTSPSNWNGPLKWERAAAASGERWLVFCASLADVFDNEVPDEWRADLWRLIRATPHLTWQLVTKRIGNVMSMCDLYDMENVWIGATIVNQEEANRDAPKLAKVPAAIRFVSYEPALGPVDWRPWIEDIDWIIVGGESTQGGKARPFAIEWARYTIRQCKAAKVPVFMKQVGSDFGHCGPDGYSASPIRYPMKDRAGADPAEWPEDLRVQEFPDARITAPHGVLDSAIVKAIEGGKRKFYIINAAVEPLALPLSMGGPQHAYRAVDRRLQALRKRGVIAFSKGEWRKV